jgi:ribose transport system substrate-binding protein
MNYRLSAALGAGMVASLLLAGCSSSSSGGQPSATGQSSAGAQSSAAGQSSASAASASCVSAANQGRTGFSTAPTLQMPAAIDGKKFSGKTIVAIPESYAIPDDAVWVSGLQAAAASVGVKVKVILGGGTPNTETQAIQEAISQNPAAVATFGIVSASVSSGVSALAKANIPLIAYEPGFPTTVKYVVEGNWPAIGKLQADYMLAETGCKLNGVIFTSSAFSNITEQVNATTAEITRLCPSCQSQVIDVDPTQLATTLQPDTVDALQKDPNVNYLMGAYDGLTGFMIPGVKQANSKVPIISNTGTTQNLTQVEQGTQAADIEAAPTAELGWMTLDDAMRAIAGEPPAAQWAKLPIFLITSANVTAAKSYLSSTAYESQFKSLWGVS